MLDKQQFNNTAAIVRYTYRLVLDAYGATAKGLYVYAVLAGGFGMCTLCGATIFLLLGRRPRFALLLAHNRIVRVTAVLYSRLDSTFPACVPMGVLSKQHCPNSSKEFETP